MAEVVREVIYREIDGEYEPFLSISPKVPQNGYPCNFAIRMEDLWMYTPDKNPEFERWMYRVCGLIVDQFGLGLITSRRMAEIASTIEDGIDDLLKAPPNPPGRVTVLGKNGEILTSRCSGDGDHRKITITNEG